MSDAHATPDRAADVWRVTWTRPGVSTFSALIKGTEENAQKCVALQERGGATDCHYEAVDDD